MAKQKISGRAVAADIRSGISEAEMMEKHSLSIKGLEHLFQKLIENHIVTAAEISAYRKQHSKPDQSANVQTTSEPPLPTADPEIDPKLAKAIVEDVRAGRHDYDIMIRLGLGREELRALIDNLVRLGLLSAEEIEARKSQKTKQCPHCRGQVFEDADKCQHCGRTLVRPMPSAAPIRPGSKCWGTTSDNFSSDEGCAWDDYWKNTGSRGLFKAYFRTVSQCLRSPKHFFCNLPLNFGYWAPMLFGAISIAIPITFYVGLFGILTGGAGIRNVGWVLFLAVWVLFGASVFAAICLFISSLFLHGSLMLFGAGRGGFQATFRVASYSSVTSLFGLIPLIGWLAGNLWWLYLGWIGFREMHQTSKGRAFGAVLLPICATMVVWVMFGLQHNPLTASKQSASAKTPIISSTTGIEFKTDVGQFSVMTPSPLIEKKVAVDTVIGKIEMSFFSVTQDNIEYTVAYSDTLPSYAHYLQYLPHFSRTYYAERILDKYGENIAKKVEGKLVSEIKIMLDDNPGREAVIDVTEKLGRDAVMRVRAFQVRNRLYQVMVAAPKEEIGTLEVNDFFESFTVFTK